MSIILSLKAFLKGSGLCRNKAFFCKNFAHLVSNQPLRSSFCIFALIILFGWEPIAFPHVVLLCTIDLYEAFIFQRLEKYNF